jgi:hypothetical protein
VLDWVSALTLGDACVYRRRMPHVCGASNVTLCYCAWFRDLYFSHTFSVIYAIDCETSLPPLMEFSVQSYANHRATQSTFLLFVSRRVQPVDTYLVCGEKGKALDLRDVYDVAVNPEVIYAVNADLTGQLLTKVRVVLLCVKGAAVGIWVELHGTCVVALCGLSHVDKSHFTCPLLMPLPDGFIS